MARATLVGALICVWIAESAYAAEPKFLNSYIMRAYEKLKSDPTRAKQGYRINAFFTKDLDYGTQREAIKAKNPPYTMCNAAVTETLIEAINLYAKESNGRWSPQNTIPADSWTRAKWSGLMPHLFAHNYMEYEPLKHIPRKDIPEGLGKTIKDFHSEQGMSVALEKFGLGESIEFEHARPGDIITFDRDRVTITGKSKPSGHSVIFLSFLTRDQTEVARYKQGQVVGFKYFSSQQSEPAGLSERWAYFRGEMCPIVPGDKEPNNPNAGYCRDAVDSSENRARFSVFAKHGQPRDCCVIRKEPHGLRVGRVLMPDRWKYKEKRAALQKQEGELNEMVKELVESRARSGEQLKLLAMGAVALEKARPQITTRYFDRVQNEFDFDLRDVANAPARATSVRTILGILRITPKAVVRSANQQVTTAAKNDLQRRVHENAIAQLNLLYSEVQDVSNAKLDGESN